MAQRLNADDSDHSGSTISVRLRPDGALRRPPPEDLHHRTGTADPRPRLLPLRHLRRGGGCPRDRALGLADTSLSPGATRMVGLAAADFSFAAASDLLWELAGVRIDTKQVERCAEALGRQVATDERDRVAPAPAAAPTMYLGLDW